MYAMRSSTTTEDRFRMVEDDDGGDSVNVHAYNGLGRTSEMKFTGYHAPLLFLSMYN